MATGNVLSRGVFIVAAKRTPFGAFGGSLKAHSPVDLQVDGFLFSSNKCCESVLYKVGLPEPPGAGIFVWSRSRFFCPAPVSSHSKILNMFLLLYFDFCKNLKK